MHDVRPLPCRGKYHLLPSHPFPTMLSVATKSVSRQEQMFLLGGTKLCPEKNHSLRCNVLVHCTTIHNTTWPELWNGLPSSIMWDLILDQTKIIMHVFSHKYARFNPSFRLLEKNA